jgi:hypothetical protein
VFVEDGEVRARGFFERGEDGRASPGNYVGAGGCGVERKAEGEGEGFLRLRLLDAEFVEETFTLRYWQAGICDGEDEVVEGLQGVPKRRRGVVGVVALAEEDGCGVDVLAEASDLRAKASGKVRREGGEPFDGGVDSGEEGGISVERLWGCGLRSRSSASRRMTTFEADGSRQEP